MHNLTYTLVVDGDRSHHWCDTIGTCQGNSHHFKIETEGDIDTRWLVDGVLQTSTDTTLDYTFGTAGYHEVKVLQRGDCFSPDFCDTLRIVVNVNPVYSETDPQTACDSYTWIDGNTYTESNSTATHTLTTAAGCDSTITLNLTINHSSDSSITVLAFASELPLTVEGSLYTDFGFYPQHFINAVGCDSTLNISIIPYPDNVDSAECVLDIVANPWDAHIINYSANNIHNYYCPIAGDIDGDGIVEIITALNTGDGYLSNKIRIFRGTDLQAISTINITQEMYSADRGPYAIVRYPDGNGGLQGAIIVHCHDSKLRSYTINGTLLSTSNTTTPASYGAISIADFNHDGWPEVIFGNAIYDAASLQLLCTGPPTGNMGLYGSVSIPHAANVLGDENLELICGNTIYSITIASRTDPSQNSVSIIKTITPPTGYPQDGFTLAADFNLDGSLDIMVVRMSNNINYFYAYTPLTEEIIFYYQRSCTAVGFPMVGDIDGDGNLEFVFIDRQDNVANARVNAIKYTPGIGLSTLFQATHTDRSGQTAMTLFDFNQDGIMEIVYRDESLLRIINGSGKSHRTGNDTISFYNLYSTKMICGTGYEYPIIADINGDGAAEVITCGRTSGNASTALTQVEQATGRLVVIGGIHPWAPARPVWNQFAYNVTNINEDLTVPQYQLDNATAFTDSNGSVRRPYNNFLQQATTLDRYGRPFMPSPNAIAISATGATSGDDFNITLDVSNTGDNTLTAPYGITLYKDNYRGEVLHTHTVTQALAQSDNQTVIITLPRSTVCALTTVDSLVIAVNDAGAGIAQHGGQQPECDTLNNTIKIAVPHNSTVTDMQTACDSFLWIDGNTYTDNNSTATHTLTNIAGCGSTVTLNLTVNHSTDSAITFLSFANELPLPVNGTSYTAFGYYQQHLTNAAGCDSTLNISIIPSLDNVNTANCTVSPATNAFEMVELFHTAYDEVASMSTPLVADVDGDGLPEIIACRYYNSSNTSYNQFFSNGISIYNGQNGTLKHTFTVSRDYSLSGQGIAIADVDNDGKAEIFILTSDRYILCYSYSSSDNNWTQKWMSSQIDFNYLPTIVDLMADGNKQVVCGPWIFNAQNGALLLHGTMESDGKGFFQLVHPSNLGYTPYLCALGDIDGDNHQEICAGRAVYKPTLTNYSGTAGNTWSLLRKAASNPNIVNYDGETFLLDFDGDGDLDICVVGTPAIPYSATSTRFDTYVWEGQNTSVVANASYTMVTRYGPTIAYCGDLDGNGTPEIVYALDNTNGNASEGGMMAYTYDPAVTGNMRLMHRHVPFSETAGFTVFDFNQDGSNEIVYQGIQNLYIVDGTTLNQLCTPLTSYNPTHREYPIVADVNGDGHAEIVLVRSQYDYYYDYYNYTDSRKYRGAKGFVSIYGSSIPGAWSSARKVWNQWVFNGLNINEDLTVPQHPISPATRFPNGTKPYNKFLGQVPYINRHGDMFNLAADAVAVSASAAISGDNFTITIEVSNSGDNTLTAPYGITIYKDNYHSEVLHTHTVNNALSQSSDQTINITLPRSTVCALTTVDSLVIAINDTNTGIAQHGGQQPECDTLNNTIKIAVPHNTISNTTATACDSFTWYDNTYTTSTTSPTHVYTNANGCDSTITLNLTVNHSNTGTDVQTACDSYTWIDGNTYTSTNSTATYTLTNTAGCDSVVTLNLTVNSSVTSNNEAVVHDTITALDLPYTYHGIVFDTPVEDVIANAVNVAGCDSLIHYYLHVRNAVCIDTTVAYGYEDCIHAPLYGMHGDYQQRVQSLYQPYLLTHLVGRTIDSLHYDLAYSATSAWCNQTWVVSVGTSTRNNLYSSFDNDAVLTEVYRGPLTANASQGMGIKLDTTFTYTGGKLLIQFTNTSTVGGYASTLFNGVTPDYVGATRWATTYNGGDITTLSGTREDQLPMVTFHYCRIDTTFLRPPISRFGDTTIVACDSLLWNNKILTSSGTYLDTVRTTDNHDSLVTLHLTINHSSTFSTEGAINSYFSVDSTHVVEFSKGNLQYQASTNTWRFAEHQYDIIGNNNRYISSTYSDWIDLFGWGCSGWNSGANAYQPYSTSTTASDYYSDGVNINSLTDENAEADWAWHNAISNGGNQPHLWRTPTHSEWQYVFNERTTVTNLPTPNARFAKAKVNNIYGVILFPDKYTHPTDVATPVGINATDNTGMYGNIYNMTAWNKMEQAGAVFLPVPGYRSGTSISLLNQRASYYASSIGSSSNFADGIAFYFPGTIDLNVGLSPYCGNPVRPIKYLTKVKDTIITACNNYIWHGSDYHVTGEYFDTLTNVQGCDSIFSLNLTLYHSYSEDSTLTVCDHVTWYGNTVTQSGDFPHTIYSSPLYDCDSIVTLHLTVNHSSGTLAEGASPAPFSVSEDVEVYFSPGNLQYRASTGQWRFAEHQYDYIGGGNLQASSSYDGWIDLFGWGCSGWSNGSTTYYPYNTSTTYSTYYQGDSLRGPGSEADWAWHNAIQGGGDKNHTWRALSHAEWLYLINNRTTTTNLPTPNARYAKAMVNGTYGVIIFPDTYTHPHVIPSPIGINQTGDSGWNGNNYTTSQWDEMESAGAIFLPAAGRRNGSSLTNVNEQGRYWTTDRNSNTGKFIYFTSTSFRLNDGISVFNGQSVRPVTTRIKYIDTTIDACNSYQFGTNIYTSSGVYTDSLQNAVGCDSIIRLNLIVNLPTHASETLTACDSLIWNNTKYTTSGNYTYAHTDVNGCTQVDTLHLTINHSNRGDTTVTACDNFTWYGNTYTSSTNPTHIYTNAAGCDSTVTLILTINHSNTGTEVVTTCDSYTWHENTYTSSNSTDTFTETNASGCDSTVTLNLTVNYSNTGVENITACDIYTWHGTAYTTSNSTATFTETNATNCDSIVTLNLTVNYSNTGTDIQSACDSYTWIDGQTYTASNNTALYTLTNADNCDSIVSLNLTVNYSNNGTDNQTACDSYTWHGITYSSDNNTATFTETNVYGCDSTVSLNLTINHNNTGTDVQIVCDTYTWIDGQTYTSSNNTVQYTLTNANNCDSVVTLNLAVNYSNAGTDIQTACDSYTWIDGNTYTESNTTATQTLTNVVGCDSTITLNLTINHNNTGTETVTACDSYTWHGTEYTASNSTATYTETNVAGCDSVVTLNLTVNHSNTGTETVTACDSYTWHGTEYTASNSTATYTETNAAGCDSVVTLNLTVNYSNTGTDVQTACDSYTWHGTEYTASNNTATFTETNADNCDSTVTLNLTVNYSNTGIETITSCNSYIWHGTEYTESTSTPTFTSTNVAGCDSITTLNLTINHCSTTTLTTCDSYVWNGTTYTESGTYTAENDTLILTVNHSNTGVANITVCDTYTWHGTTYTTSDNTATFTETNTAGCDSVITLNLTINYSNTSVENITACDSYTWHGTAYTISNNTDTYTETNASGCDSVVTLNLTINYSNTGTDAQTACDSYSWHGTTYSSNNNTATYTETNTVGCDSVVTLNLTINYSNTGTETVTACDSYAWHGATYTTSNNTDTFTETNTSGCDSVVTLNLTINYSNTGTETVTACDSYTWHGTSYYASNNTDTFTETNAYGCDSVVTLKLTINYSNTGTDVQTACDSYTWHGTEYTASNNTATFTETNADNCDSTVTLNLTVNYSNTGIETITSCNSYIWHGTEYTESTSTPTFTSTNVAGCDSITTLNLTINHCSTTTLTTCDSYVWNGTTYTESGTYTAENDTLILTVNHSNTGVANITVCDTYTWHGTTYTTSDNTATFTETNTAGCDSVITLNLTVNYSNTGTDVQTACDTYTWIDGNNYTSSNNTATSTMINTAGCDSVVALNLTVNYSNTGVETITACDSYVWKGGIYTTSNDSDTFTETNANNCDSVVTLHLTINYSNTSTDTQTACDSFSWIDGNTYTASNNTAQYTLTNAANCDSLITLNLTINYSNTGTETITACNSYIWHGTEYSENTSTPTFTTINDAGCDSVTTLNLTINHCSTTTITACNSYEWNGSTYTEGGTYTTDNDTLILTINYSNTGAEVVEACDSYIWHGTTYTTSNSTATFTETNAANCDSIVTLNLTVNYSNTGVENVIACDNYTWHETTYTTSNSTATFIETNTADCDSVVTLNLTVNYSNTGIENVTACDNYTWHEITYTASNNTATFTETNIAGCDSVINLNLTINYSNTGTENITACNSYIWHGTEYTESTSTPTFTSTNMAGCDSVTTLNLTINQCSYTILTTCDSYLWNGTTYTESGTYSVGNDTLILTVNYSNTGSEIVTACDTYTWHGTTYTASNNTATFTETNTSNCDSVVTLNLTVNHSNTGIENITACDTYTWHGTTYTISNNTDTFTETNAEGCDSVVTLNLTVNYSNSSLDIQTACDTYTWMNNQTYTASNNTAQYTLTNTDNCDSVITLNLTVNYSNTYTENATACDSYTWHGTTYTSSNNTDTFTEANAAGCDSVINLNLTINYSNTGTENITACNSYIWHGTEYIESTTTPTFTGTNVAGCDSVTTLNLTINNCSSTPITTCDSYLWNGTTYTESGIYTVGNDTLILTVNYSNTGVENITACDSYTWHGTTYTTSNNTDTFIETNVANCDSVVTLNLVINYSNTGIDVQTACDTYTWIDGQTYTSDNNTAQYTLINAANCDSLVTLNLTANYSNTGTDVQTACDTYTWHGTTYITSNNTATFTETNTAGCDSIVTLNLTINYSSTETDIQTACDTYTWIDGNTYTTNNNTATVTETNAYGCDSMVTLNLTIGHSTTGEDSARGCNSYTWNDSTYTTSGDYIQTLTSALPGHCDSTVTLHLTILEQIFVESIDTFCYSSQYHWRGQTIGDNNYLEEHHFTLTDTLISAQSCDTILTLQLVQLKRPELNITDSVDCNLRQHILTMHTDVPYHWWSTSDGSPIQPSPDALRIIATPPHPTIYYATVDYSESRTCPFTSEIALQPLNSSSTPQIKTIPERLTSDNLHFQAIDISHSHLVHQWYIDGQLQNETSSTLKGEATEGEDSVVVTLEILSGECSDVAVAVIPIMQIAIFAPNVFTPQEAENNRFVIYTKGVIDGELTIYNREGLRVYHTTDLQQGWNGNSTNGSLCPQGAYVWHLRYRAVDYPETYRTEVGTITLLK